MKAATAYNVIQALSEDELAKLYKMLGFQIPDKNKKKNIQQKERVLSRASAEEMLRATIFNLHRK